jgi:hypothetical protein
LPPRLSRRHQTNPACLACLLACLSQRYPPPCPSRPCRRSSGLAAVRSLRSGQLASSPAASLAAALASLRLLLRLLPLALQHPHCAALAAALAAACLATLAAALASPRLHRSTGLAARVDALATALATPHLPRCACRRHDAVLASPRLPRRAWCPATTCIALA